MKRLIIVGAGQCGQMASNLLNKGKYQLIAFADNNADYHGTMSDGIPVMSVEQALKLEPDCVLIAVFNRDSSESIKRQLFSAGFRGKCIEINQLRDAIDIRGATLQEIAQEIENRDVPGAIAELGVYRGEFAAELNRLFPERHLYLFDTFEGFDERDIIVESSRNYSHAKKNDFSDTDVKSVVACLPYPKLVTFRKGYFPETARDLTVQYALVSLDADLFQPTLEGLRYFYPRLNRGGVILLHDYNNIQFNGVGEAARKFCREQGIYPVPLCDLHGSTVITKG